MKYTSTDGPAFPTDVYHSRGMTLRDYFAAKALQGLLCKSPKYRLGAKDYARYAYQYADAMLEARAKEE